MKLKKQKPLGHPREPVNPAGVYSESSYWLRPRFAADFADAPVVATAATAAVATAAAAATTTKASRATAAARAAAGTGAGEGAGARGAATGHPQQLPRKQ